MAKHKDNGVSTLEFELVEGLVTVQLKTSAGNLQLLADTGSSATTLKEISPPGNLVIEVIELEEQRLRVKPYPTQSPVFARLNATVPREKRIDGVLGQDFFSQFSSVAFGYVHHRLILVK